MIITKNTQVPGTVADRNNFAQGNIMIYASKSTLAETISLTIDCPNDDFIQLQVPFDSVEKLIEAVRNEYAEGAYHD